MIQESKVFRIYGKTLDMKRFIAIGQNQSELFFVGNLIHAMIYFDERIAKIDAEKIKKEFENKNIEVEIKIKQI